jgi:hypothetical protein
VVLGMAEEFRADGIAGTRSARTAIDVGDCVDWRPGFAAAFPHPGSSPTPHMRSSRATRGRTGPFFIDDDVLRDADHRLTPDPAGWTRADLVPIFRVIPSATPHDGWPGGLPPCKS